MENYLEEVLSYLKEACDNEVPLTLSSLMNTLRSVYEFRCAHLFRYREDYLDLGYYKRHYGAIISFFPNANQTEDFDDVAIYIMPYEDNTSCCYRKVKFEDQIIIAGIEANKNKVCGGKSFVALVQNEKYISPRFIVSDYADVKEFAEICQNRIREFWRINI